MRPGEGEARDGDAAKGEDAGARARSVAGRPDDDACGRGKNASVRGWWDGSGVGAVRTRSEGRGRTRARASGARRRIRAASGGTAFARRTSFDELDPEHNTSFGSSEESEVYDIVKITAPVAEDMEQMRMNLRDIIGRKNPLLLAAADQIFEPVGSGCDRCWCFLSRGRRKS